MIDCTHRSRSTGDARCDLATTHELHVSERYCRLCQQGVTKPSERYQIQPMPQWHDDGMVRFEVPAVEIPRPTRPRAVCVIAPDEHSRQQLAITGELMREYASRHGADFVALTELPYQKHACGYKYAAASVAALYEQTLYLDCDIVVMRGSPDLFAIVPASHWGVVDELASSLITAPNWIQWEWAAQAAALGRPGDLPRKIWNAGMLLMPRLAARWFQPPPVPVPGAWVAEQMYLARCLDLDAKVHELSSKWNACFPSHDWPELLADAHFIHLNGCRPQSTRLKLMRHFAAGHRSLPASIMPPLHVTDEPGDSGWRPHWLIARSGRERACDYLEGKLDGGASCRPCQQAHQCTLHGVVIPRHHCSACTDHPDAN